MSHRCYNRLTIVGRKVDLKVFEKNTSWPKKFGARHRDLLECSPARHAWQFESDAPPLEPLQLLSTRYPLLTFLLEYDWARKKGLAKAKNNQVVHHQVSY